MILVLKRTLNNVFFTAIFDGKPVKTFSAGSIGFKNAKRDTPFAAEKVGEAMAKFVNKYRRSKKFTELTWYIRSPVDGHINSVVRGFALGSRLNETFTLTFINRPSLAHNGCRPPKARRI